MILTALSDQELLASLQNVCASSRKLLAQLLLHLNEVEARRLDAKAAFPSMFDFCIHRLGMSDGEACRRVAAARLVKRYAELLERIESGALNLTTLYMLRDLFTESNAVMLADAASGKTKRQVEELVARMAPKPDVAATITELPTPARVLPGLEPQGAVPNPPSRVVPLSEGRYEVRFTADRALRDKIERAKDLLRHRHPDGDLAAVMHRAFDALEKERLGKSKRPQQNPKPTTTDEIPQSVRRAVFERDGEQCTFVGEDGRRCCATGHLELDHIVAKARGGSATLENLRVRCRAHNRLHAEEDFGAAHVAEKIRERQVASVLDAAKSGLVKMGFRSPDAARVLSKIASIHATLPPIEEVLREALIALT